MPALFLLFNHTLTDRQRQDAAATLGVDRFVEPPPGLWELWRQVPADLEAIAGYLDPVRGWLDAEAGPGDRVLIQGDFGACYLMVRHALERGLVPVYSTTQREAREVHDPDGSVTLTHRFVHRIYRRYGR